jgi:hypothetical protein
MYAMHEWLAEFEYEKLASDRLDRVAGAGAVLPCVFSLII